MLGVLRPTVPPPRPAEWFVAFRPYSTLPIARFLPFLHHKHVIAFGKIEALGVWVFFNPGLDSTDIAVVSDEHADRAINEAILGATVVKFVPSANPPRGQWRFLCTLAVARAIGSRSCALRPDRFLRDLLAEGGEIVVDEDKARGRPGKTEGAQAAGAAAGLRAAEPRLSEGH